MKSIQVENTKIENTKIENTKVGNILEEDIESVLKNLGVNAYLKQNLILFICDKSDIKSYKKEVIERFISRMKRDCMIVYISIMLTLIINYYLICFIILNIVESITDIINYFIYIFYTLAAFILIIIICLIYLSYFLWNNTFTSNIRQWWSFFFFANYIVLYFVFLNILLVSIVALKIFIIIYLGLKKIDPNKAIDSNEKIYIESKIKDIKENRYTLAKVLALQLFLFILFTFIVLFYFIPNNCEHEDSDLQKVLSKLEETEKEEAEKLKRLEKEEKKRLEEKETENKEEN